MKKIIIFLFLLISILPIFAVSITDFSVQYKNGKYYNFYDNPSFLFELLNEKNNLNEIGIRGSKEYSFESCMFHILSREFLRGRISSDNLYQAENDFLIAQPNHYYSVDYFEAFKNFKTIRNVEIGDDINKVLDKYPEAVLYKNNGKYKWELSDCYHEKKLKKSKNLSEIGYVLLKTANWQYNRSWEMDFVMHYELVFVIKDSKVKSIVMQIVLDAM